MVQLVDQQILVHLEVLVIFVRSVSKNLETGYKITRNKWKLNTAIFHRWDDDLVDWTYDIDWETYRKANHVDITTFGLEIIASREWANLEAIVVMLILRKTKITPTHQSGEVSMH